MKRIHYLQILILLLFFSPVLNAQDKKQEATKQEETKKTESNSILFTNESLKNLKGNYSKVESNFIPSPPIEKVKVVKEVVKKEDKETNANSTPQITNIIVNNNNIRSRRIWTNRFDRYGRRRRTNVTRNNASIDFKVKGKKSSLGVNLGTSNRTKTIQSN